MSTSSLSQEDSARIVAEEIKIIENRNLMMVFWIFTTCYGLFTMMQYWPGNAKSCISLSENFGPESCSYVVFAVYLIQPLLYCSLVLSLMFTNFDVIDENDDNPIEIRIENKRDEEIQLRLKASQSSHKLRLLPSISELKSENKNLQHSENDHKDNSSSNDTDDDDNMDSDDIDTDDIAYDHLHFLVWEKLHKCEDLGFPLRILLILIIVEIGIVIYFHNFWYIFQVVTDLCGYLLWLVYTSILTKLKFEHKVEHSNTKVMNYVFLLVSIISLCVMTYEMLSKDLEFNTLKQYGVPKIGFVQVILESTLLLELISIVIENLLHVYCSCFHHSYHPIHDAPDISHLVGKTKCILAFLVFGLSSIILSSMKLLQNDASAICSSFTLSLDFFITNDNDHCLGIFWVIQLIVNGICLGVILSEVSCNCHLLNVQYLIFPVTIAIFMILCQFGFFMNSGNEFYLVQIMIDITGYSILLLEGLFFVRYFIYINTHSSFVKLKKGMDINMRWMIGGINSQINLKLLLMHLAFVFCFITAINSLILNFYTDVGKIEESAQYLAHINHGDAVYEMNIERWMFLQIVFENTLIIEYLRILAKTLDLDFKAPHQH